MTSRKTSLKSTLITLLAWTIDEAFDWVDVLTSPYIRTGLMSYQKETWSKTLISLSKTGYINRKNKNNKTLIGYSDKNKQQLIKEIPLARKRSFNWDKLWREVIFDIPEEEEKRSKLRTRIRKKLIDLGFGKLQESVWISPFDFVTELENYFESLHLSDYVKVLEARYLGKGTNRELAQTIWPLNSINKQYLLFLSKWEKKKLISKDMILGMHQEYLNIVSNDPALPNELLPVDWHGEKAKKLFLELLKQLALKK